MRAHEKSTSWISLKWMKSNARRRRKWKKLMKKLSSYASVHHHGWSTQADWTNFFRAEFSSVHELVNTEFQLLMCYWTCLKDCMGGVEIIFCVLLWLKLGPKSLMHFSEESRKIWQFSNSWPRDHMFLRLSWQGTLCFVYQTCHMIRFWCWKLWLSHF